MLRKLLTAAIPVCVLALAFIACSQPVRGEDSALQSASTAETQSSDSGEQSAAPQQDSLLDAILGSYSSKSFSPGEIPAADLTAILEAGARAPSARNLQPWHFSVVRGLSTIQDYVQSAADGNVLIIVSGTTEEQEGVNVAFDCGLATENLYVAAQALGYGAHIYAAPVSAMNQNKSVLGIPEGYEAVAAVLISLPGESADAVTGASARNPLRDTVTYVEE